MSHASSPSAVSPGSKRRVIVEGLMHRAELVGLELREAHARVASTAAVAGIAVALALLAGFTGTFAIAAAVWDRPDRGLILSLVTLAYLVGAAALAWWTLRRMKSWRPFSETLYQFREDCSCLHQYLSENTQ
jgi:uncharacterized membrane protein YqjE